MATHDWEWFIPPVYGDDRGMAYGIDYPIIQIKCLELHHARIPVVCIFICVMTNGMTHDNDTNSSLTI